MAKARRRPPLPASPPEERERGAIWWWLGTILLTALTLYLFSLWGRPYLNVEHEGTVQVHPEDVPEVAGMVSQERLQRNVERLAGFGTRLSGSAGADAAADFLKAELVSILGAGSVREEIVDVDNPFDLGTKMRVGGEEAAWFRVHPLWAPVVGTYALPEEGRYLGIVRKVSFRRLLRDRGSLRGAAAAINWLSDEDLHALAMEAVEAGQFKGKLKDPITSHEREAIRKAKAGESWTDEDRHSMDSLIFKHQARLTSFLFARLGASGVRSLLMLEPPGDKPVRIEARSFADRILKAPSKLPRYLIGPGDASRIVDGGKVRVAQAPAELTMVGSGESIRIYPFWPNLVRTSSTPRAGLKGNLVWVGRGTLAELKGKKMQGSIALVDFNCAYQWVALADMGAQAVLLAEPPEIMRGEADNKHLSLPADIPRFWVSRADVEMLKAREGEIVQVDAQVVWERRPARILIAELKGTMPDAVPDPVVIHTHYDSVSVVPEVAPGGEQACGAAAVLELARVFKRFPLKKTTLFVLTSGHCQMMRGWAEFLHRHYISLEKKEDDPDRIKPAFVVDIDLTTRARRLAVFYKGHRYNTEEGSSKRIYSTFGKNHTAEGKRVAQALGYGEDFMVDAVNAVSGRTWDSYVPGRFTVAQELTVNAGLYGLAYMTPDDERVWVDTPHDLPRRMDFESLARQVKVMACVLPNQLNVGAAFSSSRLPNYWTSLSARVVEFDHRTSFLPNRTVSGSMVWVHNYTPNKTLKGVRGDWFIQAIGEKEDGGAFFELHGLPNSHWLASGWIATAVCAAYEMDPLDGGVRYAPDMGPQGSQAYRNQIGMNEPLKKAMLVVFPCRPLLLFDLVDPLRYSPFYTMIPLDADTDSMATVWGAAIPEPNWYSSYVEPLAVAFASPDRKLKLTFSVWLLGKRLALVNATPEDPEGIGYAVGDPGRLNFTAMHAAQDMWRLNEFRINKLKRHGVVNHFLEELHALAADRLKKARNALSKLDYREAVSQARAAWGLSSRVYPEVENTAQDVVKSAMLFLALLMPFAYLFERLLFGFPRIVHQVLGVLGIFLAMFIALRLVHPAFQIALTPVMILLAFIILALSTIVIGLISSRFFEFLREERELMQGVHKADVSKVSVGLAAFSLGVSNMRKRALRTFLTSMTLVALMFAVLSLTSVIQAVKQRKFSIGKPSAYEGLLFRATNWSALGEPALRYLETEMGSISKLSPRAWFVSYQTDRQSAIEITHGDKSRVTAVAALGMTEHEPKITGVGKTLVAGRWLRGGESHDCLLPVKLAGTLFIGPEDVGRAQVVIFGVPFTVRGLFDPQAFGKLRDLDDEELAPVNFEASEKRRQQENITSMYQAGKLPERYEHHDPSQTVIVSFEDLMRLGGKMASIAVPVENPDNLQATIKQLLSRLGLLVYVGLEGKTYAYSAIGDTASEGLGYLFVPVLIAGFIVFSTMLGAVQERTREISVFSSVGLAPDHVAVLFFAEACVYAILGAVIGYLLGQSFSHLIVSGVVLEGLNVNYSSDAAIMAALIVMAVVLLSTIYPAYMASKLARPSQATGFVLPPLVGDKVKLELPFSFNERDAQAICAFLAEFFEAHAEASAGEFSAGNIRLVHSRKDWELSCRVWLAPYDFGVSQDMEFTMREGIGDESSANLVITRLSGDQASWRRVNSRFLKTIRKQFLIWRAIGDTSRLNYFRRAAQLAREGLAYAAS